MTNKPNFFGVKPAARKPAAIMALDALASMSHSARADVIVVAVDGFSVDELEALSNLIGRAATEKHRAFLRDVASAGDCPSLLTSPRCHNE